MGIECKITQADIQRYITETTQELVKQISLQLEYLGQECVKRIRVRKDNWNDQTGNLRSSIAAAVYGKAQKKSQTALQSLSEGEMEAQAYINTLAKTYSDTYALVVVAAMEYAGYVEANPNKDVLNECRLWAEKEVDVYLKDAVDNTAAIMNTITL